MAHLRQPIIMRCDYDSRDQNVRPCVKPSEYRCQTHFVEMLRHRIRMEMSNCDKINSRHWQKQTKFTAFSLSSSSFSRMALVSTLPSVSCCGPQLPPPCSSCANRSSHTPLRCSFPRLGLEYLTLQRLGKIVTNVDPDRNENHTHQEDHHRPARIS